MKRFTLIVPILFAICILLVGPNSANATPLYVEKDLIDKTFADLEKYIIDIPASSLTAPSYNKLDLDLVFDVVEVGDDGWDDETQNSVDYLTILTVLDSGDILDVFSDMVSYNGEPLRYIKSSTEFGWSQGDGDIRFEVFSDVSNPQSEFWTLRSATVGSTPEPGTLLLLGSGLLGVAGIGRKRITKRQ